MARSAVDKIPPLGITRRPAADRSEIADLIASSWYLLELNMILIFFIYRKWAAPIREASAPLRTGD
jgi:hypothetical protein